jgi:hypothetical protein
MIIFKCVDFCTIINFAENEVLTALIVSTNIFWDATPCSLAGVINVSEEITTFIIRVED